MIQIIASVLFVGFVLYKFFTNPRWWNLLTNSVVFVIVSILVATFVWDLGFPPSFVGYMIMLLTRSGGPWNGVIILLLVGALIPLIISGIGWIIYGMSQEDHFDEDRGTTEPIFKSKSNGDWRMN